MGIIKDLFRADRLTPKQIIGIVSNQAPKIDKLAVIVTDHEGNVEVYYSTQQPQDLAIGGALLTDEAVRLCRGRQ